MMNKKFLHAGFTIETALIMPMVLTVIMVVVYLNIYLYNRVIMQTAVCRGAQKVFYYEMQENSAVEGKCAGTVLKALEDSLVCMKDVNVKVTVSQKEISVTVRGELNVPEIIYLESLGLEDFWIIETEWTESRLHAPTLVKTVYHTVQLMNRVREENSEETDLGKLGIDELPLPNADITGK